MGHLRARSSTRLGSSERAFVPTLGDVRQQRAGGIAADAPAHLVLTGAGTGCLEPKFPTHALQARRALPIERWGARRGGERNSRKGRPTSFFHRRHGSPAYPIGCRANRTGDQLRAPISSRSITSVTSVR